MAAKQAPLKFVEDYYISDLLERNSPESLWFLSWLKNVKGDKILSLGCGPNFYDDVLFFDNIPKCVVGIDINPNNVDFLEHSQHPELLRCKNCIASKNVQTDLFVADILTRRKDFIGSFDAVYAMGVLGMFESKKLEIMLNIISDYLKPRGVFLDIDWTDCRLPKEKYQERKNFNWYDKGGPTVSEIGKMIRRAGFSTVTHDVYQIANPVQYGWGTMYAYSCLKY